MPRFPFFPYSLTVGVLCGRRRSLLKSRKNSRGEKANAKKSRNPTRKELCSVETSFFFVVVASRFRHFFKHTLIPFQYGRYKIFTHKLLFLWVFFLQKNTKMRGPRAELAHKRNAFGHSFPFFLFIYRRR